MANSVPEGETPTGIIQFLKLLAPIGVRYSRQLKGYKLFQNLKWVINNELKYV